VNEVELGFYTQGKVDPADGESLRRGLRELRGEGDRNVIVTLGPAGAAYLDRDELVRAPGRAVRAVDTTGAGDCFTGALAAALSEEQDLENAILFANTAASLSVQVLGASASLPGREAVEKEIQWKD
jgi:ribokinase